jgi:hypothetical protein
MQISAGLTLHAERGTVTVAGYSDAARLEALATPLNAKVEVRP